MAQGIADICCQWDVYSYTVTTQDIAPECVTHPDTNILCDLLNVLRRDLFFTRVSYSNLRSSFIDLGLNDSATLNLGDASDSSRICSNPTATGSDFTININFSFPIGGTLRDRSDPLNIVRTGKNHQFEWLAWDFVNIDSSSGHGSMFIKLFRRSHRTDYKNTVDFTLTGHNPSGTTGDFSGRGTVHLVCP